MRRLIAGLVFISACLGIGFSQNPVGPGPLPLKQIVFMIPVGGGMGPAVPGPGAIYEIAVMNLDGSGFRVFVYQLEIPVNMGV